MLTDPINEYYKITNWLSTLIGSNITPTKLVKRLRKFLKQSHPVKISLEYNTVLDFDDFAISAEYDVWRDEDGKKPIALSIYINHLLDEPWTITEDIVNALSLDIVEALAHEYQHLYQYRIRNYMLNEPFFSTVEDQELKEEQEYLGQLDEIDAYAANIAVRMYIKNHPMPGTNCSLDLNKYRTAFGNNHWVVRRLLKKISKRLLELRDLDSQRTLIKT